MGLIPSRIRGRCSFLAVVFVILMNCSDVVVNSFQRTPPLLLQASCQQSTCGIHNNDNFFNNFYDENLYNNNVRRQRQRRFLATATPPFNALEDEEKQNTLVTVDDDDDDSLALDLSHCPAAAQLRKYLARCHDNQRLLILLDVENLRGKSGFGLEHDELLHGVVEWKKRLCCHQQQQRAVDLSLVVDHGREVAAYYVVMSPSSPSISSGGDNNVVNNGDGVAVVFSGPRQKADDVIAHDLGHLMNLHIGQEEEEEQQQQQQQGKDGSDDSFDAATTATSQHHHHKKTSNRNHMVVVTADRGLIDRCRRAASDRVKDLTILSPLKLLQDLEYILTHVAPRGVGVVESESERKDKHNDQQQAQDSTNNNMDGDNGNSHTSTTTCDAIVQTQTIQALEHEIKLGAQLLEAEALLRNMASVKNNKRKGKLKAKVWKLREQLHRKGGSLVEQVVNNVLEQKGRDRSGGFSSSSNLGLTAPQQTALLARWHKVRKQSKRKEQTGDRVIMAEQWRRQLEERYGLPNSNIMNDSLPQSRGLAWAHVQKYRAVSLYQHQQQKSRLEGSTNTTMRLVVISDTHGFEATLTDQEPLPKGDILVHLGDFTDDTGGNQGKRESMARFDAWLAQHASPQFAHILVVRGNHDPITWYPSKSGATYVTQPTTLILNGIVFAIIPYLSGGKVSNRSMPKRCHVLCTHVPPYQLLDRCYSGQRAGSSSLRKGVERMATKYQRPPALWLCGHIHEGRGAVRHTFGPTAATTRGGAAGQQPLETFVINAANANSGIASRLEHGPVVLQLTVEEKGKRHASNGHVEIVSMDHRYEYLNQHDERWRFFDSSTGYQNVNGENRVTELLLAVDLGLRTGFSLFNDKGKLLAYENLEFDSNQALREGALSRINAFSRTNGDKVAITRIAIEGADVALREVWRDIVMDLDDDADLLVRPQILWVRPEEWRADLLVGKEKLSGAKAKEASRLIARQIVADFSGRLHEGKFPTDVAEAVLVGFHVSRRLGWVQREPAVRRYSNGRVVVPTAASTSSTTTTNNNPKQQQRDEDNEPAQSLRKSMVGAADL